MDVGVDAQHELVRIEQQRDGGAEDSVEDPPVTGVVRATSPPEAGGDEGKNGQRRKLP